MNFQDTYKELVELTNNSDALMVHRAMRAVNRSLAWMVNQHDFLYNEISLGVTVGTDGIVSLPLSFGKLVFASYGSTSDLSVQSSNVSSPSSVVGYYEDAEEMSVSSSSSEAVLSYSAREGKQIPVVTYALFKARQALFERKTTSTLNDPSYFENFVGDQNGMWFIQRGHVLEAFPAPTVDTPVSLYYQKAFTPLTATTDTHFLLSAFPDTVILKAITSTFRAYLRPDVASSFPAELFLAEWNSVIAWDTSLRSNFNQLS